MMVMMLTILVLEISFASQTAYSLAKNQIEKAQMNAVAESGFAYATNIVQIKLSASPVAIPTDKTPINSSTTSSPVAESGHSLFSKSITEDLGSESPAQIQTGPLWQSTFPVVTVSNIRMKLKIDLEETKININRLVNSEDKVDIRIRSALIEVIKLFEGTEEDVDRIIDYIDVNTLGQYESGALNAPAQSIAEILAIPNMKLKFSLENNKDNPEFKTPQQEQDKTKSKINTLADLITVRSTGRINVNYTTEEVLKAIINGPQEKVILDTILQKRAAEPFKTLAELAYNKQFASTFKKMANYVTVDENTFKVKVILKTINSTIPRVYYGYLFNSNNRAIYILRTERIGGGDVELNADAKDIGEDTEEPVEKIEEK